MKPLTSSIWFLVIPVIMLFCGMASAGIVTHDYSFNRPIVATGADGDYITMEGCRMSGAPGSPILPSYGVRLLLPPGEGIESVRVIPGERQLLGTDFSIPPNQYQVPLSYTGKYEKILPNPEIYELNCDYPQNLYSSPLTQGYCGHTIAFLTIKPVIYNPVTREVWWYSQLQVEINTVPEAKADERFKILLRRDEYVQKNLERNVDNFEMNELYPSIDRDRDEDWDMVIITNQAMELTFQELEDFNNRRGIRTRIETVEWIYVNYTGIDEQEKIRKYIIDAYNNWNIQYVLIGGDADEYENGVITVPYRGVYARSHFGGSPEILYDMPSDMYYSGLDGNWDNDGDGYFGEEDPEEADFIAEVHIGRAAVDDAMEAEIFIDKHIMYQQSPVVEDCDNILFVGSKMHEDDPGVWTFGRTYMEEIRLGSSNHGYTTTGIDNPEMADTLYDQFTYYPDIWQSLRDLAPMINDGPSFVNTIGHGSDEWMLRFYIYSVDDINLINNGFNHNFYIFYSQSCYAAAFDRDDCIIERWTSEIYHGAVAAVANTRFGWYEQNTTRGSSQYFHREFIDAMYGEDLYRIAFANDDSKIDCLPWILDDDMANRWCALELTVFADPSLDIWTAEPTELSPSYNSVYCSGIGTFNVDVPGVEGALVACNFNGELIGRGFTDPSGHVTVTIDPDPTEMGDMEVVITAHNYLEHSGTVAVIPAPEQVTLLSPINDVTVCSGVSHDYCWTEVDFADEYVIEWADDEDFTINKEQRVIHHGSCFPQTLNDCARKYWRVKAVNAGCEGPWSETATIRLVPDVPDQVTLLSPINDVTICSGISHDYCWTEVDFADQYIIEWADDEDFYINKEWRPDNASCKSHTLNGDGRKYWRVRAENDCGEGPWSYPIGSITLVPSVPDQVSLTQPANDAHVIHAVPVMYQWNTVPRTAQYEIQFSQDPGCDPVISQFWTAETEYEHTIRLSGLGSEEWYWRVQAENICGESIWSDIRHITVDPPLIGNKGGPGGMNPEPGGDPITSVQKYSSELYHILLSSAAGEKHSMIVHLTTQVDLRALDTELYHQKVTRVYRHKVVIEALQEVANRSQAPVRAALDALVASGEVDGYTPYWITNCFVFYGTEEAARQLSNRADVDYIELTPIPQLIEPIRSEEQHLDDDASTPPPGIVAVRAPEVWYELGIDGSGALIGGLDTGVDGTHPALSARWRGQTEPWQECWRSPVGGTTSPVDGDGHGTHTMGTMCGAESIADPDTVGIAPAALWIADDAINQNVTSQLDADILDGFQWFADPDGDPGTVDDVPDVVQNSWGVYSYWTGYQDCDDRWDTAILALEAGGTVVTFSAGNEGPTAQTHRSPANAIYDSVSFFSIGAVNATDYSWPYPIASFSSRGPSDCDGSTIKPEVCAPGVTVYSSVPGGGYEQTNWSGTSMAGPHVAGIIALMRSANPDIDVRDAKSILMRTAHDLGTTGEDNDYGFGFVDAYEAVIEALASSTYGRIMGTVRDSETLNPIAALVELEDGSRATTANPTTGAYNLTVPGDSTFTVRYSLYGYINQEHILYVATAGTTYQDVDLVPRPVITVFEEDFESGAPGWTHEAAPSWGDQWHISSELTHSGVYSYKCGDTGTGDYANLLDARLISPVIPDIPDEARLYYWIQLEGEISGTYPDSAYDGGIFEISADAGPFTQVAPNSGYPKTFRWESGGGNPATGPMLGQPCWADNPAWEQIIVDLDSYAGQDIQLRYRFGSDAGGTNEGWYVDDVLITGFGTVSVTEPTGFVILVDGTDLKLSWDADSNYGYRVYSDVDPM
ncbi:S8 family serine peptidase, partial [bacterium]|nr:S8 family serine peptidase [bacterium]